MIQNPTAVARSIQDLVARHPIGNVGVRAWACVTPVGVWS